MVTFAKILFVCVESAYYVLWSPTTVDDYGIIYVKKFVVE